MKPIDNKDILNYFFDDRETFVVDYDTTLVKAEFAGKGCIRFKLIGSL